MASSDVGINTSLAGAAGSWEAPITVPQTDGPLFTLPTSLVPAPPSLDAVFSVKSENF